MIRNRVSVIVVSKGKILAFHAQDRESGKKYIFLPGGQIEKDESIECAAIRETKEETGYDIQINAKFKRLEVYDFTWEGKLNHCHTWFLAGVLTSEDQTPSPVNDASYHQGVVWVPVEDISQVFGYHAAILRATQAALTQKPER